MRRGGGYDAWGEGTGDGKERMKRAEDFGSLGAEAKGDGSCKGVGVLEEEEEEQNSTRAG